jgi:Tfp pilus assembly protein PilN
MRPVNLIPPDQRRGDHAPLRTGPLPYIVIGALALALLGVTLVVLANKDISDRKSEVTQLHREDRGAQAKADRLAAYTQFQAMTEQRIATVTELANSRFDWERVMRELALILPHDVWLTSLSASAAPGGSEGSSESSAGGIQGPSLEMSGCATGQVAVAGFVTALKDIEGVTRVGLESSSTGEGSAAAGAGGEGCESRNFIAQFKLVVAFDAAPAPITGEGEPVEEPASTESAEGSTESAEGSTESTSVSGETPAEGG